MTVMNQRELPKTLRGQKHRVFGNIESIYKFHCNEFYPKLLECGDDVEQIAELFTSYVTRDYFYGYIIYAINRKRSELLCNYHVHYWKVRNGFFKFKFMKIIWIFFDRFSKFRISAVIDWESTVSCYSRFRDCRGTSCYSMKLSKNSLRT